MNAGWTTLLATLQPVLRVTAFALLCAGTSLARADDPRPGDVAPASPAALRAKYVALKDQLGNNQFERPLYLDSRETPGEVTGEIFAVIDAPFEIAGAALNAPGDWCDILTLHINTKTCRVASNGAATVLNMWIGSKHEEPLSDSFRVDLAYRVRVRAANYLRVGLSADAGPMGTRNYRIGFEAIPLENSQTFIHLSYAYGYGLFGQLAMQTYLATAGKSKIGFTLLAAQGDGLPRHIGGIRGVVERNTMRYYLAIEAFMGALSVSPQARFEKRIRDWYAASARYPRQLHEIGSAEYLDLKRKENSREQALRSDASG